MILAAPWLQTAEANLLFRVLEGAGHQALFVGGCVRNALLAAPVADLDIATDALPETTAELATAAGFRVVPTGIEHGTVTAVLNKTVYEITTFRRDVSTDGRRATVAFSTDLAEDAVRRDFTMNALYAGQDGVVIDPTGGLADLEARRVRFVGDSYDRVQEDYLRILRFFRFHAWYGDPQSGIDADGLAACAANSDGLGSISAERIGAELKKLLAAPDPAPAVAAMAQSGVLLQVLPGADPDTLAIFLMHSRGADPILRLAALGGEDVINRLRLSRVEARRWTALRNAAGASMSDGELGYRLGSDDGLGACLIRQASLRQPVDSSTAMAVKTGAAATFPVKASDLKGLSGATLGARLKELEAAWIATNFSLSKADLLDLE